MALDWDGLVAYAGGRPFNEPGMNEGGWMGGNTYAGIEWGTFPGSGARSIHMEYDQSFGRYFTATSKISLGFFYMIDNVAFSSPTNNCMTFFGRGNGVALNPTKQGQIRIAVYSDGSIAAGLTADWSQPGVELQRSEPNVIRTANVHTIEIELVCDNVDGRVKVIVDSNVVINVSGVNTALKFPDETVDYFWFKQGGSMVSFGQFWWNPGVDVSAGPKRIDTLSLTGDGPAINMNWTPSEGTEHFSLINQQQVQSVKFLSTAAAMTRDVYSKSAMPVDPTTIHGVKFNAWAQKADVEARLLSMGVSDEAFTTNFDGTPVGLTTTRYKYSWPFYTNPNDAGNPWTKDSLDAANVTLYASE